jgi:hypothetical protein
MGMKALLLFLFCAVTLSSSAQDLLIKGRILNASSLQPIANVQVRLAGTAISVESNSSGYYQLHLIRRKTISLQFHHLSYVFATRSLHPTENDTLLIIDQKLDEKAVVLDSVTVSAQLKPETLIGKPHYSIFDFDFTDHGLLLLTAERSLKNAILRFSDFEGRIICEQKLPTTAGEALYFFHDYQGFTDLLCKDSAFRIEVYNDKIVLQGMRKSDFETYVQPISDTINNQFLWTNRNRHYPAMDYFSLRKGDSISHFLRKISNVDLLKLYRLEYYYLPSRAQLEARIIADTYKTDKHIVAALMSGFTQSMYYEALYAPLFVVNDTICIFDHYSDFLFHYAKDNRLIDSTSISYHHPERWKDWKKKLYVDDAQQKIWAQFSRDGRHYLKEIDWRSGAIKSTYHLQNHSADKLKIRDGYVYYVYRPFESTQEKFLYRERLP